MPCRRAFSLIELLVVIAVIALLVSILLPALASARKTAKAAVCQSNLHQIMIGHATYAMDSKDFIATLNGRRGDWGFIGFSTGGISTRIFGVSSAALAAQAKEIIDMHTGRLGGSDELPTFKSAVNRTAIEQFSHVVLVDYLGGAMPITASVCPEDAPRLSWQKSPLTMKSNPYPFQKSENDANLNWWPYSSSYQLTPWANSPFYYQIGTHDQYHAKVHTAHKMDEVRFPALKVAKADTQQRHFGRRDLFFGYPDARQPLAFFDGSVSIRRTRDSNKGWNSGYADNRSYNYAPDVGFESPTLEGSGMYTVSRGYYRWTRLGLRGVDFGGTEPKR